MPIPSNLDAFQLTPSLDALPTDWARHRNRRTYALDAQGRLVGLNLCGCEVEDAAFLQSPDFQHLQALNLSENKLSGLRLPAHLRHLQHLNVSENAGLKQLSFEGPLPALRTLTAYECKIGAFHLPAGMDALENLDLRKNQLASLVFSGGCKSLSFLDASDNQLKEVRLPKGFPALRYLYLNDNQLERLMLDTAPRCLEILHLRKNKLVELPHNFLSLRALKTLYLHENPLPDIPKASLPEGERDNAFSSVRAFLQALSLGSRVNDRVKIILVGNGRVGKTSMFRRLKGWPFREDERFTHGIQLGDLDKSRLPAVDTPGLQANIWDFGGQEIFYATHQFFLTEDALYIICWTADENTAAYRLRDAGELPDEGKNQPREYWLENVRHRGGPNCPVLMVQTHCESGKVPEALNAVDIQKEYGAVCLDFSAKTDQGLENLQTLIAQKLNREVPFFGRKVPECYDNLIAAIEQMNPDETKINLDFFRQELCPVAGVPTGDEIEALHFLRKTGAVVWFHEVDDLSNTIFINPDWLTKQVYRLINRKLNERRGRISPDYLADVFSDFSPEERGQFLELLKNFKLIFEVKDKAVHIAPQYLPAELDLDGQDALAIIENRLETAFVFAFPKFLPDNVMINFLSHYGPFSKNLFWKNGICFQNQQGQNCLVRLLEGNRLEVMAEPGEQSFALQAEVCRAFVELSKKANAEVTLEGRRVSWQKLMKARQDKMLEIYDEDENKVQTAHFDRFFVRYSLEAESGAFEVKGGDVFFTHSRMEADLREGPKSDGPTPSQPIAPPPLGKPKVFISYAHKDEHFKDDIIGHLASLKRQGLIEHWNDRQIEAGFWDPQIEKAMQEADIFLLLITPNFLNSRYISEREITTAYQKFKAGEAKIFPVICDFCVWDLHPVSSTETEIHPVHKREMNVWLGKFQPFPKDAKPIKKWRNKNEAYASVVQSLTNEILKMP